MGIHYEVSEHLVVADTRLYGDVVDVANEQLSLLGAWILQDRAGMKLTVIADGKKYCFEGKVLTADYHEALKAIRKAESLEIIATYGYHWHALEPDPGPFRMVKYLRELLRESPKELDGVFYSMYCHADCDDTAGSLVAYGRKNGKSYAGEVPFEMVTQIPDGDWYTPLTAVVCDLEDLAGKDFGRIEAVCREMTKFSEADQLRVEADYFSFALNNLCLKNDGQLKEFIRLYAELIELTDGECSLIGELADISRPDVRVLHFDVECDGSYVLKIAAVGE